MRLDVARLRQDQTVAEALAAIRAQPPEGRIIYFYVVDHDNVLKGVVPTRRLLLNPLDERMEAIMVKQVIALPQTATLLDACEFFTLHRLLAFPVVDDQRRLLGVVDVELYTNELSDLDRIEQSDHLFQLIGVHLVDAEQAKPVAAFKKRFPWLLANFGGGILSAVLSSFFEVELAKVVSLALFIPVVLALAESVTIQSVSLTLQILQGQQPTLASILRKLRTEIFTGFFLGAATGGLVALVALVWLRNVQVAGVLLGGIFGGVSCAALIGVAIPNILRVLRREPQVAAGPIALAFTDVATLLSYFVLARIVL
jgi:magnesium transporter